MCMFHISQTRSVVHKTKKKYLRRDRLKILNEITTDVISDFFFVGGWVGGGLKICLVSVRTSQLSNIKQFQFR